MNGVVNECLDGSGSLGEEDGNVVAAVTPVQVTEPPEHGALSDVQEVIILERAADSQDGKSGSQSYQDTDLTRRYRTEMEQINSFLEDAALDLDKSVLEANTQASVNDRRLCRVFTQGQFDSGGRLYGGFWQPLSKQERLEGLRINGNGVACLDYAQMGLRIAYGLQNATPPGDDGYRLPGLEESREAIKKLLNAVLLANKPLTGLPKGIRALLPEGISLRAVMDLLTLVHTQLQPIFFSGIGHRIQYISSQILVDVLLHARDDDMVALPVGDALIVAQDNAERAEHLMQQVFVAHAGVPAIIRREAATAS